MREALRIREEGLEPIGIDIRPGDAARLGHIADDVARYEFVDPFPVTRHPHSAVMPPRHAGLLFAIRFADLFPFSERVIEPDTP